MECFISNGGLVLLHPFITRLFTELALVKDGEFVTHKSREKAVGILHYITCGDEIFKEYEVILEKLLCGFDINTPIVKHCKINNGIKKEVISLLETFIQNLSSLRNTSIDGFREFFLMRNGKLIKGAAGWKLIVERKEHDILLNSMPWSISMVRLPFQKYILTVEW